jgi:hypothetical protein
MEFIEKSQINNIMSGKRCVAVILFNEKYKDIKVSHNGDINNFCIIVSDCNQKINN